MIELKRGLITIAILFSMLLCGCGASASGDITEVESSTENNAVISSDTVKSIDSVTISYEGHLSGCQNTTLKEKNRQGTSRIYTEYYISSDGSFLFTNDYDNCEPTYITVSFSEERSTDFFDYVLSCDLSEYEIKHPNEDGVMVTEYPQYSVMLHKEVSYQSIRQISRL